MATLVVCSLDLSSRQLWFDEHASWWAASLPFAALWKLLAHVDAVLAPYYLLLRGSIALLGDSEVALRLPSVLAMAACAGLLGSLGKKLFGLRTGLSAGLLFSAIPSVTRYGQEARPYALVAAMSVLATLLLLRALDAAQQKRRWLVYALALIGVGLLHLPALCLLAAHGCACRWYGSRAPSWRVSWTLVRPWLLSVAGALLVLSPLVWIGRAQSAQIAWNNPDWDKLLAFPSALFLAGHLGRAVIVLATLALFVRERSRVFLLCWAFLPPLVFFLTRESLHLFLARYLFFTVPAWVLLAVLAAESVGARLRVRRIFPAVCVTLLMVLGLTARSRSRFARGMFDHRGAAAWIRGAQRPGDAIAFGGTSRSVRHGRIALRYELREGLPRDVFAAVSMLDNADFLAIECAEAAACLSSDVKRIWLVTSALFDDPWAGLPEARARLLETEFDRVAQRELHDANVLLLVRKP